MTDHLAAFAATFAALYAAHQFADHWVQTQHQAETKGQPGRAGRLACLSHVLTYTITAVAALAALTVWAGLEPAPVATGVGLAVSAASHYVVDRRSPLRRMADALKKSPAWLDKGGGMYAMDQSWHVGWLFIASLIMTA